MREKIYPFLRIVCRKYHYLSYKNLSNFISTHKALLIIKDITPSWEIEPS